MVSCMGCQPTSPARTGAMTSRFVASGVNYYIMETDPSMQRTVRSRTGKDDFMYNTINWKLHIYIIFIYCWQPLETLFSLHFMLCLL